jgi:polyferredoxin
VSSSKLGPLKKIRVYVSLVFFIAFAALFLDARHWIPPAMSNALVSFQFIPSVLKVFSYTGLATLGLVVILVLTILFGRVYCSTLCPLGTLQDIIIHIGKKINRKKRFRYEKPPFLFHYFFLALALILLLAESMTLVNLFEPFSNFGRILTNLIEPLIMAANNTVGGLLQRNGMFFLYNLPLRSVPYTAVILPLLFLVLIVYLSYKHGRFFCNVLCPAGAILGLISRFSLFKIVVDEKSCNECGACEKVCKANCILADNKQIDYAACVNCYNCIKSCPTGGVVFRLFWSKQSRIDSPKVDNGRRKLFKATIPTALMLGLPAIAVTDSATTSKSGFDESRKYPITPPGSENVGHFTAHCTACHLCVTACPSRVLYPAFLDYGVAGIFQPKMSYISGYCQYECVRCGQVCPTGAIMPLTVETKKLTQIGKASYFRDDCIVVTKKQDCAACSEHCPTKAVYTVKYMGKLFLPELNNELCIGCGACEHACPTTPRKAIYVTANHVHQVARKPVEKIPEKGFDSSQEFPF